MQHSLFFVFYCFCFVATITVTITCYIHIIIIIGAFGTLVHTCTISTVFCLCCMSVVFMYVVIIKQFKNKFEKCKDKGVDAHSQIKSCVVLQLF